ncbi:MAG: type II toxin-antitoxin system VapC family toxin [Spirochaetaceae bacterium]|nr:MAG: type II toxin-antitoxin system VapC family toxin [Spirochaetaceae bacterium]
MNAYLLDTHTFLWWSLEPDKLPGTVQRMLSDPAARVVFSVVSTWEAQIKAGLGKLEISDPLQAIVERELVRNRWEVLPVHLRHTWALADLPPLHRDPFDRLLIAQAKSESLALVTADPLIREYPGVATIWDG